MERKNTKNNDCCSTTNQTSDSCCTPEEGQQVSNEADCGCNSSGFEVEKEVKGFDIKPYLPALVSFVLLLTGLLLSYFTNWFSGTIWAFLLFFTAYIIVGKETIKKAFKLLPTANLFNEFFLMTLATIGAFAIGEFAEAVAVMLFYEVGELFNASAVKRAKRSIKALLDIRPDVVTTIKDNHTTETDPKLVSPGEVIQTKPGERVALDGELLSETSSFNTSALTGESMPRTLSKGEKVLAGMINLNSVSEIKVTSKYEDSSLSKILNLVQDAVGRKAKTERFISKFAKVYTPIVFFMAVALAFLPYLFLENYIFQEWLYRALVFLVISCPCALVISIPLGFFGGIGAASKNGVLFKGSNFLDYLTTVDTVVLDKTGTLTRGVFTVQELQVNDIEKSELLKLVSALESRSSHPIAKAIVEYSENIHQGVKVNDVEEIPGHGLKGVVDGQEILAGNAKLLKKYNIQYDPKVNEVIETLALIAVNGQYKGHFVIADQIKEDAQKAVEELHSLGISNIVMLSGDKDAVTQKIAKQLGISQAFGGLLPEDKVAKVEELKKEGKKVAFVGDGVNDAPVIALADVGIAMGGLGSDATIETADVVIQTDQPSKIATAIQIGKATKSVVWQNIAFAFGFKVVVLTLGALGIAGLWEAVFADVGVALLAVLNAVRVQRMKF